jgi:hypothetical protein
LNGRDFWLFFIYWFVIINERMNGPNTLKKPYKVKMERENKIHTQQLRHRAIDIYDLQSSIKAVLCVLFSEACGTFPSVPSFRYT